MISATKIDKLIKGEGIKRKPASKIVNLKSV